jgi:hypothetical protein
MHECRSGTDREWLRRRECTNAEVGHIRAFAAYSWSAWLFVVGPVLPVGLRTVQTGMAGV